MLLWLTGHYGGKGLSGPIQAVLKGALAKQGIKPSEVIFNSLHFKTPLLREHTKRKAPDKRQVEKATANLRDDIRILRPSLIVVNDDDTLSVITGKKYTLATTRGSLYYFDGIPCIVIEEFKSLNYKDYAQWQFEHDLAKIVRWYTGRQKNEPAFRYTLCNSVDQVVAHCAAAENSVFIAEDIETANGFITSIAFTYIDAEGKLVTFTVPFYNPQESDGAYWRSTEEEIAVRKAIQKLQRSPVLKGYQNGTYDCAYQLVQSMEPVNYLFDSQNMMHCLWVELPKKLHNISSYFIDHYTYWKDEGKGDKEDGFGKGRAGLEQYWRYNGLDSYYTFLCIWYLVRYYNHPEFAYAIPNYDSEFTLSIGPCLAASMRGIPVDRSRHNKIMAEQLAKADEGREDLKRLSGDRDYNVGSPNDNAWLLYDVLGAQTTRLQRKGSKYGPRSTDEKVLFLMKEQRNFFINNAIDRIFRAKKPQGILSKYGNWYKLVTKGRFLSWHNAAATETFRFNSGSSQFWTGTNGQNLQPFIQEMFVAYDDYVIVDCDYSASDDWFIAYHAGDEGKINTLKTKDTHSFHAATFFKLSYDDVVRGKKAGEAWVVDAIKGVRQIAKKFNHGANFRMGPEMLYNLMGRDMAVSTAKLMGHANAEQMSDKELIGMCRHILDLYDHPKIGMYKRIRPWHDETTQELKDRHGLVTNAHGITRSFLKSPDDHAVQRALSSYYGQSGTSGNINRALREIFYSGLDDGKRVVFVLQVHDSLKFLVHRSALHLVAEIKAIMEKPVTINGNSFVVPVSVECGITDGKKMLPWRPDITYEELVAHEAKTYAAKFPKGNDAFLNTLGDINLDGALSALETELGQMFGIDPEDMSNQNDDAELVME